MTSSLRRFALVALVALALVSIACEEPCGDTTCADGTRCGLGGGTRPECVVIECDTDADCANDRVCTPQGSEDDPTLCGAVCHEPARLDEVCESRADHPCTFARRCASGAVCSDDFQSEEGESVFAVCERAD